jgi:quercetin dioxygenase-like cupin family protein
VLEPIELPEVEFHCVDDVFIKQMVMDRAGIHVFQHVHTYDHNSLLALGAVELWCDEELEGVYRAPSVILIRAGVNHRFVSLEKSIVYCIHNVSRSGEVELRKAG